MNVWDGERLGGERLTIVGESFVIVLRHQASLFPKDLLGCVHQSIGWYHQPGSLWRGSRGSLSTTSALSSSEKAQRDIAAVFGSWMDQVLLALRMTLSLFLAAVSLAFAQQPTGV